MGFKLVICPPDIQAYWPEKLQRAIPGLEVHLCNESHLRSFALALRSTLHRRNGWWGGLLLQGSGSMRRIHAVVLVLVTVVAISVAAMTAY